MGDLNQILAPTKSHGGAPPSIHLIKHCKNTFNALQVYDLGFKGHPHTWYRGSLTERLDRALDNQAWFQKFPNSTLYHLPFTSIPNHCPILLNLGQLQDNLKIQTSWKYEYWWKSLEDYEETISSVWTSSQLSSTSNWLHQAQQMLKTLHMWSKDNIVETSEQKLKYYGLNSQRLRMLMTTLS